MSATKWGDELSDEIGKTKTQVSGGEPKISIMYGHRLIMHDLGLPALVSQGSRSRRQILLPKLRKVGLLGCQARNRGQATPDAVSLHSS